MTRAGSAIEGTVELPVLPKLPEAPILQRYQLKPGQLAPAPPPIAVVYLEGSFPKVPAANPVTLQIGQKGFQFSTRVLPVRTGTRVEFPNFDDEYHNVFSYSRNKRFDLGRYRKDETPPALVFDKPGLVRLFCDIHEHMRSGILVLDTPHFVTTDAAGNFRITNLPAGEFMLKAWLDERTTRERRVTLKAGETARVDFPAP